MNTPLITWLAVITVMAIIGIAELIKYYRNPHRHHTLQHHHPIITMGNERDEFFIPGDSALDDED